LFFIQLGALPGLQIPLATRIAESRCNAIKNDTRCASLKGHFATVPPLSSLPPVSLCPAQARNLRQLYYYAASTYIRPVADQKNDANRRIVFLIASTEQRRSITTDHFQ
jgi:hypothetical protein